MDFRVRDVGERNTAGAPCPSASGAYQRWILPLLAWMLLTAFAGTCQRTEHSQHISWSELLVPFLRGLQAQPVDIATLPVLIACWKTFRSSLCSGSTDSLKPAFCIRLGAS